VLACRDCCWRAAAFSVGGDGVRRSVRSRIANAKSFGWAIYAAGFAVWLFGYLSAGHAPVFDWNAATPWWISSFVPNLEAELGLALMFASAIPTLPWARLFPFAALLVVADQALDLGTRRVRSKEKAPLRGEDPHGGCQVISKKCKWSSKKRGQIVFVKHRWHAFLAPGSGQSD
jgi:hypothetical protein